MKNFKLIGKPGHLASEGTRDALNALIAALDKEGVKVLVTGWDLPAPKLKEG